MSSSGPPPPLTFDAAAVTCDSSDGRNEPDHFPLSVLFHFTPAVNNSSGLCPRVGGKFVSWQADGAILVPVFAGTLVG